MTNYRDAGVDQRGADRLIPEFARLAARTRRPEVVDDIGGFASLFSIEALAERGYRRPALVCSTDGVGTKVELLRRAGRHHTAGWDCVAMNADDVVCVGAEPLLFLDYVSVERLDPGVVEGIVAGVADGCVQAGCTLVGGETSQHPGLLPEGGYDVVGTCVGIVDRDRTWGPARVRPGDEIVGLASTGLHANGYSLVRRLLGPEENPPDMLLAPTAIYARTVLDLAQHVDIHAAAHVTGGGIPGNLARALPPGLGARVDVGAWPRPEVFGWLEDRGLDEDELRTTFNLGIGMVLIVPESGEALRRLEALGTDAWSIGSVVAEEGIVLEGDLRRA